MMVLNCAECRRPREPLRSTISVQESPAGNIDSYDMHVAAATESFIYDLEHGGIDGTIVHHTDCDIHSKKPVNAP